MKILTIITAILLTGCAIDKPYGELIGDKLHEEEMTYMRQAAPSVYRVIANDGEWSGTGFAMMAKSGDIIVITNKHVCDGANRIDLVREKGLGAIAATWRSEVLEISTKHDLCALTAPESAVPLKLARDIVMNERTFVVGYPQISYMTITSGYYKGVERVIDYMGPLKNEDQEDEAEMDRSCHNSDVYHMVVNPKNHNRKICILNAEVLTATSPIGPGASGSPIMDSHHGVIGVAFEAADDGMPWAGGVPQSYLIELLNNH